MVKYLEIHKCSECGYYDCDPATVVSTFWGEHVCTKGKLEDKWRILKNDGMDGPDEIPEWCELDGPNDL
jgi:hypothetical protein